MLLEVLALWAVLQVGFILRPPEGLKVSVSRPERVVPGKPFPLTLVVRNEGKEAFTVTNVTARGDTLKKVALADPRPAPARTTRAWGAVLWSYQKPLEPGEKWTLRFDATVHAAGEARGAIEVQAGISGPRRAKFLLRAAER